MWSSIVLRWARAPCGGCDLAAVVGVRQAKLQKGIDRYTMEAQASHEQLAANARFEARVTFVNPIWRRCSPIMRRS